MSRIITTPRVGEAAAQDRPPPLRLTRDVSITFHHSRDGAAGAAGIGSGPMEGRSLRSLDKVATRILRQAATGRARNETSGVVGITDPCAKLSWTFDTNARSREAGIVTLDGREDEVDQGLEEMGQGPGVVAERQPGTDRVAGIPCTTWRLHLKDAPADEMVLVCFAADGLALRSTFRRAGMTSQQEAVRVAYGALDAALFEPPQGWPVRRPV